MLIFLFVCVCLYYCIFSEMYGCNANHQNNTSYDALHTFVRLKCCAFDWTLDVNHFFKTWLGILSLGWDINNSVSLLLVLQEQLSHNLRIFHSARSVNYKSLTMKLQ